MLESHKNIAVNDANFCLWHKQSWNVWQKLCYALSSAYFCSWLVKREPVLLYSEELKFEWEKYFFCINVYRTTVWSPETKILAHFLGFRCRLTCILDWSCTSIYKVVICWTIWMSVCLCFSCSLLLTYFVDISWLLNELKVKL